MFMTDNSDAEKNALKSIWPEADQKRCGFHMDVASRLQEWRLT